MGFDEEVDRLKQELQTPKLDAAGRKAATMALTTKLKDKLNTKRLIITFEEIEGDPSIVMTHAKMKERLGYASVNEDGSITFQSTLSDEVGEGADFDDSGYFPPYTEYYDAEEFLEEAPDMLKQGIAEYELDQEDDD